MKCSNSSITDNLLYGVRTECIQQTIHFFCPNCEIQTAALPLSMRFFLKSVWLIYLWTLLFILSYVCYGEMSHSDSYLVITVWNFVLNGNLLLSYPRFKSVCPPWVMLPSQDCYVYRFNHNYWSSPSIVLIYVVLVLSLSFRETSWSLIQHVYVIYCRINLINLVNLINFRDTTSITLCFVI